MEGRSWTICRGFVARISNAPTTENGGKNLSVCDHYGPDKGRRMLRCKTCKTRFSERRGTVFFGSPLPEEKVLAVLEHIDEGGGVRKTGRLVGVHRDTVIRFSRLGSANQ